MFKDRNDAGQQLAQRLAGLALQDPVVFALPRGGVPVALPVARCLGAPLDLLMVRKLGLPGQPEIAAGAVVDGAGHDVVFNDDVLRAAGLDRADFAAAIDARLAEIETRRARYLAGRAPLPVAGRCAVVVDDGIATGATVRAALVALRRRAPQQVVLAVPVAAPDTLDRLRGLVDRVVCLETPVPFRAVGLHYRQFDQVSDDTVVAAMKQMIENSEKGSNQ